MPYIVLSRPTEEKNPSLGVRLRHFINRRVQAARNREGIHQPTIYETLLNYFLMSIIINETTNFK